MNIGTYYRKRKSSDDDRPTVLKSKPKDKPQLKPVDSGLKKSMRAAMRGRGKNK